MLLGLNSFEFSDGRERDDSSLSSLFHCCGF